MINRDMMIDAVSGLDTELLEWHEIHQQTVQKKHRRAKMMKILISAACIALVLSILLVSLPLGAVIMYGSGNEKFKQAVDRVLFPLDTPDAEGEHSSGDVLKWQDWAITKIAFKLLGGDDENSVIQKLWNMKGNLFVTLARMLQNMYDYYQEHGSSESSNDMVIYDEQGVKYLLSTFPSTQPASYTVTGVRSKSVREVVIPGELNGCAVDTVGIGAFNECKNLQSVTLPDQVTEIWSSSFENCVSLKEIKLPPNLTEIHNYAFRGSGLEQIELPASLVYIENSVFDDCENLKEIVYQGTIEQWMQVSVVQQAIPDGIDIVCADGVIAASYSEGYRGYFRYQQNVYIQNEGEESLTLARYTMKLGGTYEVIVPASVEGMPVTRIGKGAFAEIGVGIVTLPASVERIEQSAFEGCYNLSRIKLSKNLCYIGESAFAKSDLESVDIPSGVTEIPLKAFYQCRYLKTVNFPKTLKTVGASAFSESGLTSLTLPDGVESIGADAFSKCEKLSVVDFPSSVQSIGARTFYSSRNITEFRYHGTDSQWERVDQQALSLHGRCSVTIVNDEN